MALMAWRERDRTLVTGWGRIGIARLLVAMTLGVYAFTDTVGVDEGRTVHHVGVAIAVVVGIAGVVQMAPRFRDSFRAALVSLGLDWVVGLAFMWMFAFDPGQYTFGLIYLVLIETAAVLGRSAALGGWAGSSLLYLLRHLAFAQGDVDVAPTGAALRVALALAIALAADAVVGELRSERSRVSELLHDLDVLVWELDVGSSTLTFASEAASRLLAYDPEELLGRSDVGARVVHPDDLPVVERSLGQAAAGDEPREVECRVMTAGGSERWVSMRMHRVRTPQGLLIRGSASDVTDGKRASLVEARLAAIVDGSSIAIIGRTLAGRITTINPAAERLLDLDGREAIGTAFGSVIPADRLVEARELEDRVMNGERVRDVETVRLRSDGTAVPVAITLSPIRGEHGRIEGIATLMRDLTTELRTRTDSAIRRRCSAPPSNRRPSASGWALLTGQSCGSTVRSRRCSGTDRPISKAGPSRR
jgi:PAS domain S-box-containing protein